MRGIQFKGKIERRREPVGRKQTLRREKGEKKEGTFSPHLRRTIRVIKKNGGAKDLFVFTEKVKPRRVFRRERTEAKNSRGKRSNSE